MTSLCALFKTLMDVIVTSLHTTPKPNSPPGTTSSSSQPKLELALPMKQSSGSISLTEAELDSLAQIILTAYEGQDGMELYWMSMLNAGLVSGVRSYALH
jgi:hypothetical protein